MGQLVEVALEIDVALKEQAEKVFAENGLTLEPVSYTHLDVYKRQRLWKPRHCLCIHVIFLEKK